MKIVRNLVLGPAPSAGRRTLAVFIAVPALALGFFWLLAAIGYPWSVSLSGRPALVGEWYGELIMPTGRKHWVALDLSAEATGRNLAFKKLKGSAHVCGAHDMREYEGSNKPQNRRGTLFNLALGAADRRCDGLTLIKFDGQWNRQDVIRATARFETSGPVTVIIDRSGTVTRPGAHPDALLPISFTMRRGSERDFAAACARLRSHAALRPDRR